MSQQVTLSPSPILLRDPATSSFSAGSHYRAPSSDNLPSLPQLSERRRTSHPHNQPIQLFNRPSQDMSDRSQSQPRPRLEHRTSQTVIDLTDDRQEPDLRILTSHNRGVRARSQRPPQLGRSDAQILENVVDLTDDNDDIIITGGRELPLPRIGIARPPPPRAQQQLRAESPPLFVPQNPRNEPRRSVFAAAAASPAGGFAQALGAMMRAEGDRIPFHSIFHGAADFNILYRHYRDPEQAMPGNMDYQHGAFADRKPDHVPPPPARENFTRSPTEGDTIICPSCEEELVHMKDRGVEPVAKKGGKGTRKDREEHYFWVLKACGHTYCNECYQNRNMKSHPRTFFPENNRKKKCCVEDCDSEIKEKTKWVGAFL